MSRLFFVLKFPSFLHLVYINNNLCVCPVSELYNKVEKYELSIASHIREDVPKKVTWGVDSGPAASQGLTPPSEAASFCPIFDKRKHQFQQEAGNGRLKRLFLLRH